MELVQIDAFDAQALQARLAGGAQVFGASIGCPLLARRARDATLGRDHEPGRVRVQRLGDQLLARARSIRIGSVDEIDTEFDRTLQHASGLDGIAGRAPDAVAGHAHGAESQTAHTQITADQKIARRVRGGAGGRCRQRRSC